PCSPPPKQLKWFLVHKLLLRLWRALWPRFSRLEATPPTPIPTPVPVFYSWPCMRKSGYGFNTTH
ncbi:unnamed protein product, partial [Amoebophrya sp. A25]